MDSDTIIIRKLSQKKQNHSFLLVRCNPGRGQTPSTLLKRIGAVQHITGLGAILNKSSMSE